MGCLSYSFLLLLCSHPVKVRGGRQRRDSDVENSLAGRLRHPTVVAFFFTAWGLIIKLRATIMHLMMLIRQNQLETNKSDYILKDGWSKRSRE